MSLSPAADFSFGYELPKPLAARWIVPAVDPALVARIAAETGIPPLVARVLAARGLTQAEPIAQFLNPALAQIGDPFQLRGMAAAVERIGHALKAQEPIWIYGDYDVDGVTSMAIMHLTLRELGACVEYYIPHRTREGYGLNAEAIEEVAAAGARLIVTVDCGVTAVEEALLARRLGVDLIVTDHHEPDSLLPEACAVIDPKQPGCPYPFKDLCGAGVAFKLSHALLRTHHPDPARARVFLKSLLDLVALGTVADVVPLLGENRALVTHGLRLLRESPRPGVRQLCERAGLKQAQLEATQISFGLAPRLNAAGRTQHANFSAELLLTEDLKEARGLAEKLESFNDARRAIEQAMLDEALGLLEPILDDRVIVIAQDGWHHGVLGIVASRILNMVHRPTIVVGLDGETGKGSGRSIPGFDLHRALTACGEHLERYGGHKMAAGLTIAAGRLDGFRAAINTHAAAVMDEEAMRPVIEIDAVALAGELSMESVARLELLAPYGQGNPRPVLALEGYRIVEEPMLLKERHLKMRTAGPTGDLLTVLGWNMAHRAGELASYRGAIRLAGTPFVNAWNGRENVELELKDFQIG